MGNSIILLLLLFDSFFFLLRLIDGLIDLLGIQERTKGWVLFRSDFVLLRHLLFLSIYIGNQAFQREYRKEKFLGLGLRDWGLYTLCSNQTVL